MGSTILSVHVPPESVDVQMLPLWVVAASFVPSLLEAIADQNPPTPTVTDLSVHEPPESAEVQMWLGTSAFPEATAASFVPSLLEAIPRKSVSVVFTGPSVQVTPESVDVHGREL